MPFSRSAAQKADVISDGKNTFKGGLFITISHNGFMSRLDTFFTFLFSGIYALACKSTTICFYDVDAKEALQKMDKQPISKDTEE
ncbi:hypothetical protein AI29_10795 [bacteria symbiont BFo2 of Frankliniella occidentalis]|nr:hypothetical protein AI29_10795 [bacteria symbiont BFo2 of Frankliniella occidentalis]KYP87105.1 hypothetical protein WB60_12615 [bacteria symbiont BFo2 of Frankliniella occidentalis]KYP94523.1 hypothetical protein WB67_09950 [bacteria symbiont BFo2 of Frankliniella occidentalis]